MYIILLAYLIGALAISFLCSILEAALLSTPLPFISMKEAEGDKRAKRLHDYKNNIDRPVAAILSLNTIAHTIGAAGVVYVILVVALRVITYDDCMLLPAGEKIAKILRVRGE